VPVDALPAPHEGIASFGLVESIIPVGATTFTLTFGPYTDALGVNVATTLAGKLYPVDQTTGKRVKVVHLPSGQVILPTDIPITVTGGSATVGPLPHTGQASLTPFFYRVEWDVASSKPSPGNKTFAVTSGTTVDYDLLAIAAPVTVNTSDQAIVALLNDPTSATYAKVVALIAARAGFGNGTP
jgi:hypothetical protein